MKEESTDIVLKKILNSRSADDIPGILKESNIASDKSFQNFFNDYLVANSNLKISTIVKDSCLDKSYAYQMINGTKKNPQRDYVIALCYAARMNEKEVNYALSYTGNNPLYVKSARDAHLIFEFSRNKKDKKASVIDLNLTLTDRGHAPIKTSKGSD